MIIIYIFFLTMTQKEFSFLKCKHLHSAMYFYKFAPLVNLLKDIPFFQIKILSMLCILHAETKINWRLCEQQWVKVTHSDSCKIKLWAPFSWDCILRAQSELISQRCSSPFCSKKLKKHCRYTSHWYNQFQRKSGSFKNFHWNNENKLIKFQFYWKSLHLQKWSVNV